MTKEQWIEKIEKMEKKINDLEQLIDNDYKELDDYIEEIEKQVNNLEEKFKRAIPLKTLNRVEKELLNKKGGNNG